MDVYVVLYDSNDGDEALCHGVFSNKESAEQKILDEIATWPNEYTFTRDRDWWMMDGGNNAYWIETTKLAGTTTMNVYVVLYDSDDGEETLCYGVFSDKRSAEKKIFDEIATWPNEYTFTRNQNWWIMDGAENGYRIVTTKLESDFDISLCVSKEPDHL